MSQDLKQPTQKQVFDYVKSLCIQGKSQEARDLIIRCAGIDANEAKLVQGRMSDYIRQKTDNTIIHDMLKIEKAYFDLYRLFKDEPEKEDAIEVIGELESVLPMLNPEEKAFTHYYLSTCHEIVNPQDNKLRAYHLGKVVKLTEEGANDGRLYSCALDINSLSISAQDKYNDIKMAFHKTKKKEIYENNYKDMLAKNADKYYWELSEKMNNTAIDYKNRNRAGKKAFELIDAFAMPELKKCSYKIKLLDNLENLQRENGDNIQANKTAAKKMNFIFKSARIKKKQTGFYVRKIEYD